MGLSDAWLYAGMTLDLPDIKRLDLGLIAILVKQAPFKQDVPDSGNQDAAAVIPVDQNSVVLAIADGVGGAACGDIAARLVIESLATGLQNASGGSLRYAILNAIEQFGQRLGSRVRMISIIPPMRVDQFIGLDNFSFELI